MDKQNTPEPLVVSNETQNGDSSLASGEARFLSLAVASVLLVIGAIWAAQHENLSDSTALSQFYLGIAAMSAGFLIAFRIRGISWPVFWLITIALRVAFLPMSPGPDVYRYVWEGHIQTQGFDPYSHPPADPALIGLRDSTWEQVEHKNVSAIYPPLAEVCFRLLAAISSSPLLFKSAFVLADLAVCLLLTRRFGIVRSLLYAWNPLVIYSFAGGAHYDSWLLLCVTAAWLAWEEECLISCAVLIGAAVAIKWIALPILIWSAWRVARNQGAHRAFKFLFVGALPFLVFWPIATRGHFTAPLIPADFAMHARSCELIPAIVSWLWPDRFWRNTIYVLPLAALTLWLIIRRRSFSRFGESYLLLLLALSPMVHAWYFTWLIPFAVVTRNVGTIAVSVTAFAYFGMPFVQGVPEAGSVAVALQRIIIWLPLIAGYAWSDYLLRKRHAR